jgi:hypothetical protein
LVVRFGKKDLNFFYFFLARNKKATYFCTRFDPQGLKGLEKRRYVLRHIELTAQY